VTGGLWGKLGVFTADSSFIILPVLTAWQSATYVLLELQLVHALYMLSTIRGTCLFLNMDGKGLAAGSQCTCVLIKSVLQHQLECSKNEWRCRQGHQAGFIFAMQLAVCFAP